MNLEQKEQLAHLGEMSKKACAIRLVAARASTGMKQNAFAKACGVQVNALNNMEKARQFPNRNVMKHLYRAHRIDFNFLMHGDFSQLPLDVQELLFPYLEDANSEWDQTVG